MRLFKVNQGLNKVCRGCGLSLPHSEFYKTQWGSPRSLCKECEKIRTCYDARTDYYREYAKEYRATHENKRLRKVSSIVDLRKVKMPKQIDKIIKIKKKPKHKMINKPLGKNRCQICEIKVGKGHIEEKSYILRGKVVCHQCYKEAHERNHKN